MELSNWKIADIVTMKPEAAGLLEKYDIDFCCRGKMKLSEQVKDEKILNEVTEQLNVIFSKTNNPGSDYYKMSLSHLIDIILERHHAYVKANIPLILHHLEKVATKHGERFPYMEEVLLLFREVKRDFEQHMMKEEVILFPRIKKMEQLVLNNMADETYSVHAPIKVMEHEHDTAGRLMDEIKLLTSHYTPPTGACTTFMLVLNELKMFEEDLHRHVHLENNILFPKALALENKVGGKA